jgi:tellurite resistance protein TerC
MDVTPWVWVATLVAMLGVLTVDFLMVARRPHEPTLRESSLWVAFYVSLALLFGLLVWAGSGPTSAGEFYIGWLIEYSLSVDNLFIFMIILGRFSVPREYQQKVLLIGIVLALVMRAMFIATGAVLISRFVWVFYLFGLFLIYTAAKLARGNQFDGAEKFHENLLIRVTRRILPMSDRYDGARLTTRRGARRLVTPMLIVMIAIGTTDLVFAVDSIPAIFGITREPYLVLTANIFALMGLRQLYFLLGGLVRRLVYLTHGLAVVLGFVGAKMLVEALAENNVPFINGGEHVSWAPHVPIWASLAVIGPVLAITAVASLIKTSRDRAREPVLAHQQLN